MNNAHVPPVPGVYVIRNTANGKVYVGSSANMRYRLKAHWSLLRRGVHFSPHLTRSWSQYGEAAFECGVLESVADVSDLIAREQHWIDSLNATDPARGYNHRKFAESNRGIVKTPEVIERSCFAKRKRVPGFISPEGVRQSVINMPAFCKTNGLTAVAMRNLAAGVVTSHKGWTHENGKASRRQVTGVVIGLVGPDGTEFAPVHDLRRFCKQHGVRRKELLPVIRGEKTSARGFRVKGGRVRKPRANNAVPVTVVGFRDPSGEPRTITNVAKFCRDNGLDERQMWRLKSGRVRRHNGWTFEDSGSRPRRKPA